MGFFRTLREFHRRLRGGRPRSPSAKAAARALRLCRFEQMESRQLLSIAPAIQVGMVYFEDASGEDQAGGDRFEITFQGGAPGTRLTELSIETDKQGDGLTIGDCLFDTAPGGLGAYGSDPLSVVSRDGIDSVAFSVADGGQSLVLTFAGFDPGDTLVFTVDVDEMGFLGPNAVAEGNEFEGSRLAATFEAPHFYSAAGTDIFVDFYDGKLAASGLSLPPDNFVPPGDVPKPVLTAGAFIALTQQPLPISISGNVFEDLDLDTARDPGEPGLAGVGLELLRLDGSQYVATGQTILTQADGSYRFDGLLPGTYRVAETQPDGYLSVGARAGTVNGQTRGVVTGPDVLSDIALLGGEDSVHNDFAEVRPASIRGHVAVDGNDNGQLDPGETPLAGVTVLLRDASGQVAGQTTTDSQGTYAFTQLMPGVYSVEESQPAGYYDGSDRVGSAGGTLVPPDTIAAITLLSGTDAEGYDFLELEPVSISGYVYADNNANGVKNANEPGIAGVTIALLDAAGKPAGTATTGANGYYHFDGLEPGVYALVESQPAGYLDGLDAAGTAGGTVHNPGDSITAIHLAPGTNAENYNFGELRPVSIAGTVFADLDASGMFDPGETPLAGVTIWLLDASGKRTALTTTDDLGQYLFGNLPPATYGVEEVQPQGYLDGEETIGSAGGTSDGNDRITSVKLLPGTDAVGYDFAELVPASISGYVFQDGPAIEQEKGKPAPDPQTLRDGVLDPEDKRLSGVKLTLADAQGTPVRDEHGDPIVAYTNAEGYYEFANLRPGIYTVIETHPAGYVDGIDTPGSNGGLAINRLTPVDPLVLAELAIDPKDDAIMWIPVQPGDCATGYNFSEILVVQTEPPLPPIPPIPPLPPEPPLPPLETPEPKPFFSEPPPAIVIYQPGQYQRDFLSESNAGGGLPVSYTWHLSVIDAGQPRHDRDDSAAAALEGIYFYAVGWSGRELNEGLWILADSAGRPSKRYVFGQPGAIPVPGDWSGDGTTKIGVFVNGYWFLDLDGNGAWGKEDLWAELGTANDRPVAGDWDGDGKSDLGIFGPAWSGDERAIRHEAGLPDAKNRNPGRPNGRYKNIPPDPQEATSGFRALKRTALGKFRRDLIDHVFQYGSEDDVPVAGDWNGDGVTNIGVFRDGAWYLDADGDGRWSAGDVYLELGQKGDVPVVGDWNGDGTAELGVYRSGTWHLDTNGDRLLDARDKVFRLGQAGDVPVVGDWNGDGVDEIGVYRPGATEGPKPAEAEAEPDAESDAGEEVAATPPAPVK